MASAYTSLLTTFLFMVRALLQTVMSSVFDFPLVLTTFGRGYHQTVCYSMQKKLKLCGAYLHGDEGVHLHFLFVSASTAYTLSIL